MNRQTNQQQNWNMLGCKSSGVLLLLNMCLGNQTQEDQQPHWKTKKTLGCKYPGWHGLLLTACPCWHSYRFIRNQFNVLYQLQWIHKNCERGNWRFNCNRNFEYWRNYLELSKLWKVNPVRRGNEGLNLFGFLNLRGRFSLPLLLWPI